MKVKVRKSRIKKQRISGFLARTRTRKGRKILNARRRKGKHELAVPRYK
ncbi:MAG TPA: 50S ribosomal protein L34 [Planctomycetota bacterium]|nr:50S ribosomal protein L34 [Planctomycetota bacterium]HUW35341.1 50S ribosomal protein L34 [Planctomycetota bacterium]